MSEVIGDYLPLAIFVAISPIPIIGVILMLFTDRARSDSLSFLAGWAIGIVLAMSVLLIIASTMDLSGGDGEPSGTAAWVMLVLGVLLILLAVKGWRARPAPGTAPTMPGWMTKIDSMKPGGAFGLALLLSGVNPKNLILIAGAAVIIAQAALVTSETVIAVAAFTLIASSTVAIITLGYLFLGTKIQPTLDEAKAWLAANNAAIMAVLLLVIGATLFGKGLGGF